MKLKNISPLPYVVHDGDGLGGVVNEPESKEIQCRVNYDVSTHVTVKNFMGNNSTRDVRKIKSTMRVVIKISTSLSLGIH